MQKKLYFFLIVLIISFVLVGCGSELIEKTPEYEVQFLLEGGEQISGGSLLQTIEHGSSAEAPIIKKDGYVFDGWDQSLTGITSNKEIKAKWRHFTASEIYEKVTRATVEIVAYDKSNESIGLGSGFFYNNNGEIITNYHVIEGAYSIKVRITNSQEYIVSSIKGYDIDLDLAVLKINYNNTEYIELSDRIASIGESIYAIGSSLGLTDTFSAGNISNNNRIVEGIECYQLTAPISPGNSGGPLVDIYGKVVGINTMSLVGGDNIYFAIKISEFYKLDLSTSKTVRAVYEEILMAPFQLTTTVLSNTSTSISITSANKYRTLKFIPVTTGTYTIYSSDTRYDTYIKVYDSQYNQIDYDDDGGDEYCFKLSIQLSAGQTYYFIISMSPLRFESYPEYGTFNIYISGFNFTNAVNLSLTTTTSGNISTSGGKNYYKFTPSFTSTYVLYSNSSLDLFVTIYDSNGNQLTTNDDSGSSLDFSVVRSLLSGVTYYFEVKISPYATASSSKTGSYTLNLTSGYQITTTSTQSAYITTIGGYDLFVFIPSYSGTYVIYSTGSYDSYVTLYDGSGNLLSSNDDGGTNYNFRLSNYLQANEVYFFLVKMSPYISSSDSKTGIFSIYLDWLKT